MIFVGLTAILIITTSPSTARRSPPVICAGADGALFILDPYAENHFKPRGFFFANVWIEYQRIKEMNLSEDGVLVMQLEQRRLLIRVRNIDDLEKIYKLLITTQ